MGRNRADLGFGDLDVDAPDALAGFDPAEWRPGPARAAPDGGRAAAERTGFRSREPGPAGQEAPVPAPDGARDDAPRPRRRRTGRNAQFNLKARPETIAAFTAIADAKGWGLGETLEYAVALLQREYGRAGEGRGTARDE